MRILLAEDDFNITKIAKTVLEKVGGHKVDTAKDGAVALQKALKNEYSLIILDGMMPVHQGIDICKIYQKKYKGKKAKIIFLSAKSSQKDINQFLSLGHGYIQKPFEPGHLCHLIEDIMKKAA